MTLLVVVLALAAAWLVAEAALHALVGALQPSFQWLIRPVDVAPTIDESLIRQYVQRSFDPELGWLRRPAMAGVDQTLTGPVEFHIDTAGCRANPGFECTPSEIAVFGDSYTFCRLVGDGETWPHFLSEHLGTNVRNFGVGNYGLDQAVLRFERELPKLDSRIVVMCVVHETITRVHAYWKHYSEYGNVLAFKPRFELAGEHLVLHPSAVQKPADFATYRGQLDRIQSLDRFYREKFCPDLLRFPYLPRLVRRWRRHLPILWHLLAGRISGRRDAGAAKAVGIITRENAYVSRRLYGDERARALLTAIVRRFAATCEKSGRTPVLLILPQPVDAEWRATGRDASRTYFASLADILPVVDLTDTILATPDWRSLYLDGPRRLGPHFRASGNRLVADRLAEQLRALPRAGEGTSRPHNTAGAGRRTAA